MFIPTNVGAQFQGSAQEKELANLQFIVNHTGKSTENDLCFINDQTQRIDLPNEFGSKSELDKLLDQLLNLNPFFRPTALECIKNPLFDKVRDKKLEVLSFGKLNLDIDQDDVFDYVDQTQHNINIDQYVQLIREEAKEMYN